MKKNLILWIAIIAVFGFACGGGDEEAAKQPTVSKEPIKVGAVFAITGPASFLGEPERNTAQMIAEQVNAAGGINGQPLELIIEDTEGDPTKTALAVKKLINNDNVCAIIGPSRSGCTMAIVDTIEAAQVPLVSCAAAEAIIKPVKKWVFKTPQNDRHCVIRIYEHMKSKSMTKVALITGTTGFGDAGRKQLKAIAAEMGIEVVADETYGPKDADMTAQLTRIKGTDAQAIINWSIVPAQSTVPKNMLQLSMKQQLYQSHGFGNIKYVELAGKEAAEGLIFPAGGLLCVETLPNSHPGKALLTQYKKNYESKFGGAASTFGGHAYDALWLVVNALKANGSDKEKIRSFIENQKGFVGTAGTFNFSAEDHNGLTKAAFEMITVKDGKFVLLQ